MLRRLWLWADADPDAISATANSDTLATTVPRTLLRYLMADLRWDEPTPLPLNRAGVIRDSR